MKFRSKAILCIALIEGVLLSILGLSIIGQLQTSNENELERRAATTSRLISASLRDPLIAYDFATLESVATEIIGTGDLAYIRVTDHNNKPIVERGKPPRRDFQADKNIWSVTDGIYDHEISMAVSGQQFGYIQFGIDIAPLQALIAQTRNWTLSISLLEMLLVAVFSSILGTYLTRQLLSLRNASQIISSGNLSHELQVIGNDELAETAAAFNHMIKKLREEEVARSSYNTQLQRHLAALHTLNEIAASPEQEPKATLRRALKIAAEHVKLEFGIISQISADEYKIVVQVSPPDTLADDQSFPLGITYCSSTLAKGDLLAVANAPASEYASHPCFQEFGLAAYIGIPIWVQGKIFGTLNFSSPQGRTEDFDHFDTEFIRLLSRWAGTFLERMAATAELKENETLLREAKEAAESANRAKSAFLATMSHEIRTPMNGILGMAQLLQDPQVSEAERLDFAKTILGSGQTLLSLLNDILDLSKVESGKLELESVTFKPVALLDEIKALFTATATAKGLHLEMDWSGPEQHAYVGDEQRLRQMLSNLVGNALKFTASGHIQIKAQEIETETTPVQLEFSVTDTGIGIPQEKLDLLFKPFSQTDSSTTRNFGGTGLGLSIVRSLARQMGGEAGVDSEVGTGSRFWFRIPATRATASEEIRSRQSTQADKAVQTSFAGHVLVVEDSPTNRKVIAALLGKRGLSVSTVGNGQEGVDAIIQGNAVDLVLMDIQMPVMDGISATQHIRQWESENNRPHLPIIALTADVFEEDKQHCLSSGMDDFMAKPIAVNALEAILQRWLPATTMPNTVPNKLETPLNTEQICSLLAELLPLLAQNKFKAIAKYKMLENLVADTSLASEITEAGKPLAEMRFEQVYKQLDAIAVAQGWKISAV